MQVSKIMPPKIYLFLEYRRKVGFFPNLDTPKLFSEKIQWLKLHDKTNFHTLCADKLAVRSLIENEFGKKNLIPLVFTTKNIEELKPQNLPDFPIIIKTAPGHERPPPAATAAGCSGASSHGGTGTRRGNPPGVIFALLPCIRIGDRVRWDADAGWRRERRLAGVFAKHTKCPAVAPLPIHTRVSTGQAPYGTAWFWGWFCELF